MDKLEAFVRAHRPRLLQYAIYQCYGDEDRGEDLLQEVLLRISNGQHVVDYTRSPLTQFQWLMKLVRRNWARDEEVFACEVHENEPHRNVWEYSKSKWATTFEAWLTELSPREQELIRWRGEGGSFPDLARQWGVHVTMPWKMFQRMVKRLKERARTLDGDASLDGRGSGGTTRGRVGDKPTRKSKASRPMPSED